MTTSNDQRTPQPEIPNTACESSWESMIALLDQTRTESFGDWMDNQLFDLEERLEHFVSPDSSKPSR